MPANKQRNCSTEKDFLSLFLLVVQVMVAEVESICVAVGPAVIVGGWGMICRSRE
jgi:hypothetical protein